MLKYSGKNFSFPEDTAQLKLKQTNRYLQKQQKTLSERQNFPLCPSVAKLKHKINCQEGQNDSVDTCQSDQSINLFETKRIKMNKLKVELCKNYVEKGYCPYEKRCRFAHGVEQLRAKDAFCSSDLYRTRKCKIFFERHECKFGERCNFMHDNRKLSDIATENKRSVRSALRFEFLEVGIAICSENRFSSRLLSVLQIEKQSA